MSSSQSQKRVVAQRIDALPLRSLTAVWVALGVISLALVGVIGRSLWTKSAARAAGSTPAPAQGPTKRQIRERQEHIALTERALELARKERKAAAAAAAPLPSVTAPAGSAPAGADPGSTAAPPAGGGKAPSASAAAAPASSDKSPVEKPAAEKAAGAKPAAGGLDAMRADIAAQFE